MNKRILLVFLITIQTGCILIKKTQRVKLTWKTLEQKAKQDPTTIAYYPGGFDPLHLGHEDLIKQAINRGTDFVVVYPKPDGSVFKPQIKNQKERVILARKVLASYPQVLVFDGSLEELQKKFDNLHKTAKKLKMIGLMGSDNYRYLAILGKKHPNIVFSRSKFVFNKNGEISSDWGPLEVVHYE